MRSRCSAYMAIFRINWFLCKIIPRIIPRVIHVLQLIIYQYTYQLNCWFKKMSFFMINFCSEMGKLHFQKFVLCLSSNIFNTSVWTICVRTKKIIQDIILDAKYFALQTLLCLEKIQNLHVKLESLAKPRFFLFQDNY